MYKLGINFDEISDDLSTAIEVMNECGVQYGELRTVNKNNFVFWSDTEIEAFRDQITASGIEVVAASTPLFKWYTKQDDPEVVHDSFGFNPRLNDAEKRETIKRAIEIADSLNIPRLRIFSELGHSDNAGQEFAKNQLLIYALGLAEEKGIELFLENEPVCKVHTKEQVQNFLIGNVADNLKFWLDVANFVELGEDIGLDFLQKVASRVGYVHVKDFRIENGKRSYVPVGEGCVDYERILNDILSVAQNDIVITIETHASDKNKIEYSRQSIRAVQKILTMNGAVNVA